MRRYIVLCFSFLLVGCSTKDHPTDHVLQLAGNNKHELEKVLEHYASPTDSLKYKAAIYLMSIMAEQHYFRSEEFERFSVVFDSLSTWDGMLTLSSDRFKNKEIRRRKFDELWTYYKTRLPYPTDLTFKRYTDVENIKAELLIENIDFAFQAWQLPWSKQYSFDTFCRYILPYRVNTEPIESWRPYYFEHTKWIIDSLKSETDPLKVAIALNTWLAKDYWGSDNLKHARRGAIKPTDLLKGRIAGECYDQSVLGCSLMRAMGIATATITIPLWGHRAGGHEFSAVLDSNGNWIDFHAGDENPGKNKFSIKPPKAFIIQPKQILSSGKSDEPSLNYLQNLESSVDVTALFNRTVDITVAVNNGNNSKYAYLCTFDNQNWIPAFYGEINNNQATFKSMGTNMVYLPMIIEKSKFYPIGPPMVVDSVGNITTLKPDHQNKFSYEFSRKYPVNDQTRKQRCQTLAGGKFQVADNKNFHNAKTLYTIKEFNSYQPQLTAVPATGGRYVRYVFPKVRNYILDGPAQIRFFTSSPAGALIPMKGKHISSVGVSSENQNRLLDDDLLSYTCFTAYEPKMDLDMGEIIVHKGNADSLWIGMDLIKRTEVSHVSFCARNDKNDIYEGKWYELLYWDSKWKSIDKQKASGITVQFTNIPKQALLLLKCLDEGTEERIFTMEEGKIIWF